MRVFEQMGEAPVAGPRAARNSGRVWADGWGVRREVQGTGQSGGVWGWIRVCCVSVRVGLQRRSRVVSCRPGGSLPSSANGATILQMSVRIWWTSWSQVGRGYCKSGLSSIRRRDPVDGIVPPGERVLWPGGRVPPRVRDRLGLYVGSWDGPDPGHGPTFSFFSPPCAGFVEDSLLFNGLLTLRFGLRAPLPPGGWGG